MSEFIREPIKPTLPEGPDGEYLKALERELGSMPVRETLGLPVDHTPLDMPTRPEDGGWLLIEL